MIRGILARSSRRSAGITEAAQQRRMPNGAQHGARRLRRARGPEGNARPRGTVVPLHAAGAAGVVIAEAVDATVYRGPGGLGSAGAT